MRTVCEVDMCVGCMSCKDICPVDAIEISDTVESYNAIIDEKKCIRCGKCKEICEQNNDDLRYFFPLFWKQGWATDPEIRKQASSGGVASALIKSFVDCGGYVASCMQERGVYAFRITNDLEEIRKFVGSKYVKSNPSGVYKKIKSLLKKGEKVLFIGLPCQVAALKKAINEDLLDKLYTVDLICHGTPSPSLLNLFLNQYKVSIDDKKIIFRDKNQIGIYVDGEKIVHQNVMDCYTMAYMFGYIYTKNCYECKFAQIERISDITLGDAWGSDLEFEERKKGISLILCQTEKGKELIKQSNIEMFDIDLDRARNSNPQLNTASIMPKKRNEFIAGIKKGHRFNWLAYRLISKYGKRNLIKTILYRICGEKNEKK